MDCLLSSSQAMVVGRRMPSATSNNYAIRRSKHFLRVRNMAGPMTKTNEAEMKFSRIERWQQDRRLQTHTCPIAPGVTTVRSLDWDRDRFDIEFGLQNGTTYNSYIIEGEKLTIIDASHEKFRGLYLAALKEQIDPASISYVVANHTEPDHSGLIPDLLDLAPDAIVIGSKVCIQFLQNLVLRPFKSMVVKSGDKLDLGRGHVLEFVMAPNLHWPDTMFTIDHGSQVLFTCDAFGMHYCSEAPYDDDLATIEPHYRFYYDCLMKPNSRSVLTALKRIEPINFTVIATGHGPLLRYNVAELIYKYETWSKKALEKQLASVAVLYVSDYGFSDRLSQALARGLTKANVGVEMIDLNSVDTQELVETIGKNGAVVVMAPPSSGSASAIVSTLYASVKPKQVIYREHHVSVFILFSPYSTFSHVFPSLLLKCKSYGTSYAEVSSMLPSAIILLHKASHAAKLLVAGTFGSSWILQPVLIAESYGGDDEPVDTLLQRFLEVGVSSVLPPLRVKECPNEATYQEYEEAGTDLGQLLSKKKVIEVRKASMPSNISKAIARVSGGLYVVTATKGSSKGAMVASWVSQASFKPLGISIAVAKDRAIESLMQVGDNFVLNCLEEGNYTQTLKHFLKRFPPGADRFEGVEWVPSVCGAPILADAIAFVECVVVSRLEVPDHWIVYAEVREGNVSKPEGRTASHHRKAGDYY